MCEEVSSYYLEYFRKNQHINLYIKLVLKEREHLIAKAGMSFIRAYGPLYYRKAIPEKKLQTITQTCKFDKKQEIIFLLDTESKKQFLIFTKHGMYNNTTHRLKLFLFMSYK